MFESCIFGYISASAALYWSLRPQWSTSDRRTDVVSQQNVFTSRSWCQSNPAVFPTYPNTNMNMH